MTKPHPVIQKQKVVVTGGAGFVGSHIVDALIKKGFEVHVIDNLSNGKKEHVNTQAVLHVIDITDLQAITPIFAGSSFVFHLAALPRVQYSIDHPQETNTVNVEGTLNVLTASQQAGVKKLIFSSSSAVYGDQDVLPLSEDLPAMPQSPYALHKYIGELYCRLWSIFTHFPRSHSAISTYMVQGMTRTARMHWLLASFCINGFRANR